jgi:nucleoside-diphosphate-sugar epimerase
VLVAGGAGFIGSNLVRRLLNKNWKVDCVDTLVTGQLANLAEFRANPNFRFIQGDIADSGIGARLLRESYSEIYHLACPTGVPNIARLGGEMLAASSIGTFNLLRVAKKSGAKFLFASSAEVYGDPEVVPQSEAYAGNVDPVGPRSPYEEGKRFGEALTAFHARAWGLDARIVRIFNTYGTNMSASDSRVIPQMLYNMMAGKPVVIYGDGSQTRAFLHVDDLIDGFFRLMKRQCAGEVFNVGGDREISIAELFVVLGNIAQYGQEPIFKPHFITDHKRRLPDTARIRNLGWRPRIALEAGLRRSYLEKISGPASSEMHKPASREREPESTQSMPISA